MEREALHNSGQTRLRVLVVDDDQAQRKLMRVVLSTHYDVETVPSAEAALERLQTKDIGLLVTDGEMEKMTGYDLLAEVAREQPALPTLLVSGAIDTDRECWLRERGIAYLSKPFRPSQLLERVVQLLEPFMHKRL